MQRVNIRQALAVGLAVSLAAGLLLVCSLTPASATTRQKGPRHHDEAQPPHSHYIDPGRVLPGLPRRAAGGKPRRAAGGKPRRAAGGKAPQGENFRDCGRSTKAKWP